MGQPVETPSITETTRLIAKPHNINTFIFDMDGTLLNDDHLLSEATVQTLNELQARGFTLIIATGRHIRDTRAYIEQLGGNIFAITCNGANIHDHNGELIYGEELPSEFIAPLLSLGNRFKVHTNIYTHNEWLVSEPCETLLTPHEKTQFFYRLIDHQEMLTSSPLKLMYYGDNAALQEVEKEISITHNMDVKVTFSDPNYLEIMQRNISKGRALQFLLEKLNLHPENTIAFGDGMNDVELFHTVKHPILMGNSSLSLQTLFPHAHRAQTNHNDGVARFLREYLL